MLRFICDLEGHFRPETLVKLLKDQGFQVSLTTVYRNLSLLVQAGIIRRTDVDDGVRSGGARYEHIWGHTHHDHLVCSRCGKRVEFSYPAIDVLQDAVAREHGFVLERHSLELVGVCPDCGNADARRTGGGAARAPGGTP
ncbi:MAG: transcriptional repressor [Deltaproteobacteria bacterium]|nr:transcriptional repressor [Deltaproteobacteria bacterium]